MQLPAQLQEFLLQPAHLNPQLPRNLKHREVIALLRHLQHLPARRAEVRSNRALVTTPADHRRIGDGERCAHFSSIRLTPPQKKWLAHDAASRNYLGPLCWVRPADRLKPVLLLTP